MSRKFVIAFCFAAPLALTACGGSQDEPAADPPAAAQTDSGDAAPAATEVSTDPATEAATAQADRPAAIAQCIACHTFEKDGPNKIGPNLWAIHGQAAAAKSGFAYSNALKSSGLTWDDASLDAYLENPRKTVPGGKMSYAGMRNEEQRAEVIAYLKSLADSE